MILKFLAHLERERHNSVRSRNLRLTALRAFLKFGSRRDVTALHAVERAMAVPMKRFERPILGHLTRPEIIAVLGQPGIDWTSQRDHLLLKLLYNTGACVSEIVGVRVVDVVLDGAACVHLHGKGRKNRSVPLWKSTAAAIRAWLNANSARIEREFRLSEIESVKTIMVPGFPYDSRCVVYRRNEAVAMQCAEVFSSQQ